MHCPGFSISVPQSPAVGWEVTFLMAACALAHRASSLPDTAFLVHKDGSTSVAHAAVSHRPFSTPAIDCTNFSSKNYLNRNCTSMFNFLE